MRNPNVWPAKSLWRWFAVGLLAMFFGCGEDAPTLLGGAARTPPGPLYDTTLAVVRTQDVFPVPIALGSSPVGQLGFQLAYTTHLLLDYSIPTLVVRAGDSLRLDTATLIVRTDTVRTQPFTGRMRLGLQEVATSARGWRPDSAISELPLLEMDALAPDTLLAGSETVGRLIQLEFHLDLHRVAGYDTVRAKGTALDVNVAVVFEGFEATSDDGFLEVRLRDSNLVPTTQLIGFSNEDATAIATVLPRNQTGVASYDSTYSPGTRLVVSDGFRQHSYLQFAPLSTVVPESALVHRVELRLTLADSTAGNSFGTATLIGVIVPEDTTTITSPATNNRVLGFSARMTTVPGVQVPIVVTPYFFDIQEGTVPDRGMILRLSNEGTKVRHFEFYGGPASLSQRPQLYIVYSMPSQFEGDQ